LEYFQMPENAPSGTKIAQCANCGFRLAEVSPPTPITYLFSVSQCPICGARMNDRGFEFGRTLNPEERALLLTQWLRSMDMIRALCIRHGVLR
jgi:hypothetical protein